MDVMQVNQTYVLLFDACNYLRPYSIPFCFRITPVPLALLDLLKSWMKGKFL